MPNALIGHTGFVGGNLDAQHEFHDRYNSSNIEDIRGKVYSEIWCAGVSAVKWMANREPGKDLLSIAGLIDCLRDVQARRFVLISTVDVYPSPMGVDESTPYSTEGLHPYGLHRRMLEQFVAERFGSHLAIRLPGLFGNGLRKNIIYDFLHDNQVENVHADAVFQFYCLDTLVADISTALDAGLSVVNFAPEPVSVSEVASRCFGMDFQNRPTPNAPRYDMRTVHGSLYGQSAPYIQMKERVLTDLAGFVARERERLGS